MGMEASPYHQLYVRLHAAPPPARVQIQESDADILSAARGFMEGFDLTMQTQVGCPGGCQFCYVPSGPRLTPAPVRQNWGFALRHKKEVAGKLQRHLEKGTLA